MGVSHFAGAVVGERLPPAAVFHRTFLTGMPRFLSRRAVEETVYFRILAQFKFGL